MVPLYIIHALNNDNGNQGYVGNKTTFSQTDCSIFLIKLDEMDNCATDIVAFFSKRRAQDIKNELAYSVAQKYRDSAAQFSVEEKFFTYDEVDLIRNRTPFLDGRK